MELDADIGSDFFAVDAPAALEFLLVQVPEILDTVVGLHLGVGFAVLEPALDEHRDQVVEDDGMDAPVPVVRVHGDHQQLQAILVLPVGGLEEVPPAEGEDVSASFLRGAGDGRHREGNAHELTFRILD